MASNPRVIIDVSKIRENAHSVVELCRPYGIEVAGVTKACCGLPAVAQAMVDGGVRWLADSRVENLGRLRRAGFNQELLLLRIPMLSEAPFAVEVADIVLVSEVAAARALGQAAWGLGKDQRVVLMVDVGDLREGVLPGEACHVAGQIAGIPGIELYGVGTNHACYGGVLPTPENVGRLIEIARCIQESAGVTPRLISAGNSSALRLVLGGRMPEHVNQLRIGESILLGRDVATRAPLRGMHLDAFTLVAEVVEVSDKPSVPSGPRGQDAFGRVVEFTDRGIRRRAICAIGRQDVLVEGLTPRLAGVEVLGASSDHLILDVSESAEPVRVGSELAFDVNYGALLQAMTSPYVRKEVC